MADCGTGSATQTSIAQKTAVGIPIHITAVNFNKKRNLPHNGLKYSADLLDFVVITSSFSSHVYISKLIRKEFFST
jgi:hypothetical protein